MKTRLASRGVLTATVVLIGFLLSGCGGEDANPEAIGKASAALEGVVEGFTPKTAAALTGRLAGAAVAYSPLVNEPIYAEVLAREFNSITPENETKWGPLQPTSSPKVWDFTRADPIVAFGTSHGQNVRGHTFVWHQQLPSFVTDALTDEELQGMVNKHMDVTLDHYPTAPQSWDVVNEAIADDGSGLRDSIFTRKLGGEFIRHAFSKVKAKNSNARLYYNDYGIESINAKSNAVYALVQNLLAEDAPLQGVGFQAHLDALSAPSLQSMVANFQRFTALGLTVNISELDVRVARVSGSRTRRLAVQKQFYHRVAAACLQTQGCDSLTTWGFTDKHSWIDSTFGADDPLPFDEQYQKKPAYFGLVDGLVGVPLDDPELSPNLIANSTFEAGLDGWGVQGNPTLTLAADPVHTGLRSAVASNRTATFMGPLYDILSLVTGNRSYGVSVWARVSGATSAPLALTAQLACSGGTTSFRRLASATGTDSEWVELAGELVLPDCVLSTARIYVEGPAAGVNIHVDDLALRERPADLGPNIIQNSGFETGSEGWFAFAGGTVSATTAQAHSGTQSGLITGRTQTFHGIGTNVASLVVPGASYEANLWARIGGSASAELALTAKITCTGLPSEFRRVASATGTDSDWVKLTGLLSVPDCPLSELILYVEGPPAGVDIYIDDVTVQQRIALVGVNVITNPTFETGTSGWFPWGSVTISATTAQAHGGLQSALVSNRTASWNGMATSLLNRALPAKSYSVSGWARLSSGTSFTALTVKSRCSGGTDTYQQAANATANSTEWVQLNGGYLVPNCTLEELTIYIEGAPAGVDIYLDDVAVREQL